MEKSKKKFKDTRVGKFLTKAAPNILKGVSDVVPDAGILKLIGGLISKDEVLTPKDKEEALKLLDLDIIEIQEISKRWSSDMSSDSWLSKNVRPMMLIFLTISTWLLILMDSLNIDFGVSVEWIDLLKSLLLTTYVAYFGSRGIEKYKYISQKQNTIPKSLSFIFKYIIIFFNIYFQIYIYIYISNYLFYIFEVIKKCKVITYIFKKQIKDGKHKMYSSKKRLLPINCR